MEAGLLAVLLFLIVGVGSLALWIWALVDAIRTPDERFRAGNQLVWVIVIVFTSVIGAIVYLAVGRPEGSSARV